jgi:hypothetical protein
VCLWEQRENARRRRKVLREEGDKERGKDRNCLNSLFFSSPLRVLLSPVIDDPDLRPGVRAVNH